MGYGKCWRRIDGVLYYLAHRWAWADRFGSIPDGMRVCHTCDNPPCCNPAHLFLGTDADNAQDRASKGRNGPRTERIVRVLSDADLDWAFLQLLEGATQREVASKLGVDQATISYHWRRRLKSRLDRAAEED